MSRLPLPSSRAVQFVPLLLGTLLLVLGNLDLISGRRYPRWDNANFYGPVQILLADHARAGEFLRWDPWINGGRPDLADPQVGAFSPLNVGIGLFTGGSLGGFVFLWLVCWGLGALGVWGLGRALGAPIWGSCLGVLAFLSCGFYTGHAQHLSFIQSFSFLPLIAWRLLLAFDHRRPLFAAEAGGLWGVSALGGYPGLTISTGLFLVLWTLPSAFKELFPREPGRSMNAALVAGLRRAFAVWVTFLAIGLAVLAPTYIAFFVEGGDYSDRVNELTRERAISDNALPPEAIISLLTPHTAVEKLFNAKSLWPSTGISLVSCHVILPCLLLALALLLPRGGGWARYWHFGVGVFFLLAAMGSATPVRAWLYDLVPPTRYFRHSAIFRGYFLFTVVALALAASRELSRRRPPRVAQRLWRNVAVLSLIAAPASVSAVLGLAAHLGSSAGKTAEPAAWMAATVSFLLFVISLSAVFAPTARVLPMALVVLAGADALFALRLSEGILHGGAPILRKAWNAAVAGHERSLDLTPQGLRRDFTTSLTPSPTSLNLVTKTATLQSYDPLNSWYFRRWLKNPKLVGWATGADRIWFSPDAGFLEMTTEGFERFEQLVSSRTQPFVVVHSKAANVSTVLEELAPAKPVSASSLRYWPNSLSFRVEVPSSGWLFLSDRYTRSWKAKIDGVPTPVYRANFLFRAIEVRRGSAHVEFTYRPVVYPWLVVMSWGTLLSLIAWRLVVRIRTRRTRSRPA